jgi:DNA-binding transcriptional LysR family regulator
MLNPVWLRTLRVVVEARSFAAAARQLGYTPSAVSQQMSRLERSVDTPLFRRDRRGIVPTSAAVRLAERAAPLLDMLSNLDSADDPDDGAANLLRLGACPGGLRYVRPALRQLAEESARIALSMTAGSRQLVEDVASGILDVAVVCRCNLVPGAWPGEVISSPLAEEPLAVLLPAEHPLAGQAWITLSELRHEWWITGPEAGDDSACLLRSCLADGFQPLVVARVAGRDAATELVADGLGVSLVPMNVDGLTDSTGVVSVPVVGPAFRCIELVHAVTGYTATTAGFISRLHQQVQSRPAAGAVPAEAGPISRPPAVRPAALTTHKLRQSPGFDLMKGVADDHETSRTDELRERIVADCGRRSMTSCGKPRETPGR